MEDNLDWSGFLHILWYVIVFGYGAIVGSFLNVVIYRLPLGKSLNNPPSTCPNCGYVLGFWDKIPILSFLYLGAKCRHPDCRQPISWRYPMVELTSACLWVALYHRIASTTGVSWVDFVAQALFASVLLALVFIDLDHFIAPDELNWLGLALGIGRDLVILALVWFTARWDFKNLTDPYLYAGWLPRSLVGALVYGGALFAVSFLGFIYYARKEGESLGAVARRFFDFSEDEVPAQTGMALVGPDGESEDATEEADPPRLAFAPAFLALLCAALLVPIIGWLAPLAFLVPLTLFYIISRRPDESAGAAVGRFFRSDDLGLPASASEEVAASVADANAFAKEAETGAAGGMGLGDVKLALAIGAVLGPGLALLSAFFAAALGSVTGIVLARLSGKSLKIAVPFVPFMAAGAIICMLYGPAMVKLYMERAFPEPESARRFETGSRLREIERRNARVQPR